MHSVCRMSLDYILFYQIGLIENDRASIYVEKETNDPEKYLFMQSKNMKVMPSAMRMEKYFSRFSIPFGKFDGY